MPTFPLHVLMSKCRAVLNREMVKKIGSNGGPKLSFMHCLNQSDKANLSDSEFWRTKMTIWETKDGVSVGDQLSS
jgi:hypothetical protein